MRTTIATLLALLLFTALDATAQPGPRPVADDALYTYRVVLCFTDEFGQAFSSPETARAMVEFQIEQTVSSFFTTQAGIRLEVISTRYWTGGDPFTDGSVLDGVLLAENQATLDALQGVNGYDLGLVITVTDGARTHSRVGSAAVDGLAAHGAVGLTPAALDGDFDAPTMAHTIAHMLGATHTFASPTTSCGAIADAATAVELRLGEIRGRLAKDLVRAAELAHFTLEMANASLFVARGPVASALFDRAPTNPLAKCLCGTTELRRDHADRFPLGGVLALAVQDHPDRLPKHLGGVPAAS